MELRQGRRARLGSDTGSAADKQFCGPARGRPPGTRVGDPPLLSVREDLEAGRLVSVLPDYEVYHGVLSLVRPPTPFEPPKLRVFIDFITATLRERARYDPRLRPGDRAARQDRPAGCRRSRQLGNLGLDLPPL